jgi:hypothetical protein
MAMNQDVLKKMKYTVGTALIVNAPEGMVPAGWSTDLANHAQQSVTFAILFVKNEAQFREQFDTVCPSLVDDAMFWVCYPKKTSGIPTDVNRDVLWRVAHEISEHTAVANVAVDNQWSALRFRHQSKVKRG